MQDRTTKLESESSNVGSVCEPAEESPLIGRPETALQNFSMDFTQQGKFTYASGSTPLEGFTIKRGIGVGGFGEVYFALSDAGKEVALKRIQRNLDIELRGVRQCLNLKHLNLISLWDIRSNEAGESWVVMEYVPGPSLRDLIESHPQGIPPEKLEFWFSSTAAGVAYLHDQGIVHRDLKPANIFFDQDQQVIKIGDYGLSKFISCSRRSGQTEAVGTFHYMAPEIGKGNYGKEIDIYALGILLFEMLTGDVPFNGESTQEIIMKHLTTDPDLDQLPTEFRDVLCKAMRKDPERRFRDVNELIAALPWSQQTTFTSARQSSPATPEKTSGMLIDDIDVALVRSGIAMGHLQESKVNPETSDIQFLNTPKGPFAESTQVVENTEPIAQAVQGGFSKLNHWWLTAQLPTPIKVLILVVAGLVLVVNSGWLLPVSLALGLAYLTYFGIRALFRNPNIEPRSRETRRVSSNREQFGPERFYYRRYLAAKAPIDRATELLGSLLVATSGCVIFNLLGMTLGGFLLDQSAGSWAVFTWLTLTCVTASWALLVTSKCWEHREGDIWLRRLTMGGIGLITGLVSCSLASYLNLNVSLLMEPDLTSLSTPGPVWLTTVPAVPAYLLFFIVLFGIIRWWKQADPTRKTRLSNWSVAVCLIWAALFSHFMGLDPVWNCILAVVISSSTQLAAFWLPTAVRQQIQLSALNETRTI